MWQHTAPSWIPQQWAHTGGQGVTLFFAISGFLITSLLIREHSERGGVDLKKFYIRRALRIFPLYYFVLAIYIVSVRFIENGTPAGTQFFNNLPYFATYTSNIFVPLDGRVIFYFSWSLATEEQFYLIWPVTLLLIGPTSRRGIVFLGLIICACIADIAVGSGHLKHLPISILGGALAAVALHQPSIFAWASRVASRVWLPIPIILLPLTLIYFDYNAGLSFHICACLLVATCAINEKNVLAPALTTRPAVYLGSISYGLYMYHMLCKSASIKILSRLDISVDSLITPLATLVLSCLIATISYRYYESWFLSLKNRFAQ
ncbi:MAG: acyltransferase [Ideonella sp. MAG2]|nr:MAG: acyltransferase [Ideonella sp. MAG2]